MIFNVMENKEELLFALKELNEGEVSDISSNLEQYILHVSKTGETMFAWQLIKPLLTQKLRKVSDDFYAEMPTDQMPSRPNMENVQYQDLQNRVIDHLNKFSGTPFTIQRLCELLVNPRSHYTRPDKFLRGIEKIVMVVSTVEAMKVANGSANTSTAGCPALSDEEGSDILDKSASGAGLVNGVWGGPPTPPGAALSPNRPSSPALDLTDRPDRAGPLPGAVAATHPGVGMVGGAGDVPVSHLRPMGQLEAFVQNVSQRLTNQVSSVPTSGSPGIGPGREEPVSAEESPDASPPPCEALPPPSDAEKDECDSSCEQPVPAAEETADGETDCSTAEPHAEEGPLRDPCSTSSTTSSSCSNVEIDSDQPPAKQPRLLTIEPASSSSQPGQDSVLQPCGEPTDDSDERSQ